MSWSGFLEGRNSISPAKPSLPQVGWDLPWALLGHRVCPTSPQMSSSRLLQIRANSAGNRAPRCVAASCHILINGTERDDTQGWVIRHHVENRGLAQHPSGLEVLLSAYGLFDGCIAPACGLPFRGQMRKKRLWHYQALDLGYTSKSQRNC